MCEASLLILSIVLLQNVVRMGWGKGDSLLLMQEVHALLCPLGQ